MVLLTRVSGPTCGILIVAVCGLGVPRRLCTLEKALYFEEPFSRRDSDAKSSMSSSWFVILNDPFLYYMFTCCTEQFIAQLNIQCIVYRSAKF